MTNRKFKNRDRLTAQLIRHGAKQVCIPDLLEQSQIVWQIKPHEEVSETCVQLEELMASAARSCRDALNVMERMDRNEGLVDKAEPVNDFETLTIAIY